LEKLFGHLTPLYLPNPLLIKEGNFPQTPPLYKGRLGGVINGDLPKNLLKVCKLY
jgi:hypothetical protein